MLTKTKLRALSPGQWARVRVPDYECWRDEKNARGYCRTRPGDEVDICVMPIYMPRYDEQELPSTGTTAWPTAALAHRGPITTSPEGSWITTYDFGLIDPSMSGPNWDKQTCDEHYAGKGKWLYEPASDDPELCPGGDWSRYECSLCGKFVKPFSNDQGELICPWCEGTGLLILDDEQLDRLEQVREFARSIGLTEQLEHQLGYLAGYGDGSSQVMLGYDFAPAQLQLRDVPARSRGGAEVPLQRRFDFSRAQLSRRWLVPVVDRQSRERHWLVLSYLRKDLLNADFPRQVHGRVQGHARGGRQGRRRFARPLDHRLPGEPMAQGWQCRL